jgi:hypothetical protein
MREYNRKLDMLEKQVSRRGLDRDRDEFPEEEDPPERSSGADEDCAADDDSGHLTQHQIHHIFEKLAIHRRRLNGRGYAYTSDVNEEQERTYPGCELLTRNKVEESWDDWKNEDAKRLFRRRAREGGYDRDERHDIERREAERREVDEEDLSCGRDERQESKYPRIRALSQEQFEAVFVSLAERCAELNRWGYPYVADVHDEQRERFRHTRPASAAEVERAFDRRGRHRKNESRRDGADRDGDDEDWHGRAEGEGSLREHQRSGDVGVERTFQIFDEILLGGDRHGALFPGGYLPELRVVNQRLAERGESHLGDEDELKRHWIQYLLFAAKGREEQGRVRRRRPAREESYAHEDHAAATLEVDFEPPGLDTRPIRENGHAAGERANGRKRKPE